MLEAVEQGEPQAEEELLPLVYDELRRLAHVRMASQPPGQTLQATALIHEAWLKLAAGDARHWNDRRHFYFAAAEAMRQILIDRARRKRRVRHGGHLERLERDDLDIEAPVPADNELLLGLNEAIDELERTEPVKARIVKLKFFIGLTDKEVAAQLDLCDRTVKRHWAYARAWLFDRIEYDNGRASPK
jgi:RNA polymerase sigma factor (TIGR02999 family)